MEAAFEEFKLEHISSHLSLESIKKKGKELVLIAAPAEVNIFPTNKTLKFDIYQFMRSITGFYYFS